MESLKIVAMLVVFIATQCGFIDAFGICGDETTISEIQTATTEIVKRLMAMRKPDWTWSNSITSVALQVTVPQQFFGREKTTKAVEENIKMNFDKMNLREKAEHTITAQALCLNRYNVSGINMIERVTKKLTEQFPCQSCYPLLGYDMLSIGIASLCISGESIEERLIEKLIAGQNKDGSFGVYNKNSNTVMLLPAVQCLRQMSNLVYNVTKLDDVVEKMREYIIKDLMKTEAGDVSSLTMIGLWKSREPNEDPSKWRCRELSEKLGVYPPVGEDESHLISRLMRIHGKSLMDVANPGFGCITPDPIPDGYAPTFDKSKPSTDESKAESK